MERTQLTATSRDIGKGHARRARVAGAVPAVLYGKGREAQALMLDAKSLAKALQTAAGMNVLVDLSVDGKETVVSRFKDVQKHPLKSLFMHADLQAIDLTQKIVVEVPLHFIGKADGVKNDGGILEVTRRSLDVRCLPAAIPSFIELDISPLKIGESLHANDVKLPDGVEFSHSENFSIVQVMAPQKEEEAAPAAAAVAPGDVPAAQVAAPDKAAEGAGEAKEGKAKKGA